MKDRFFIGSLAGLAGAGLMALINFIINLVPGINMELIFGVSGLFVPETLKGTLQGAAVGLIAHLACGALVGLVILGILETFGYEHIVLKGAILGLFCWFSLSGILGRLLTLGMQDKFIDNALFILIHFPFGITTAWLIKRYRMGQSV
ncbi:MAG TPA: hypothetical protein VNT57_03135 [Desulfobacteria bacterium]|nr:hypothetical protein [Desulfobacteria bacterium]